MSRVFIIIASAITIFHDVSPITALASFGVRCRDCALNAEFRAVNSNIRYKSRRRRSFVCLQSITSSSDGSFDECQRQLVVFRPPSRHTYGFVNDPSKYDLPQLELSALIHHFCDSEVQFVPVCNNSESWARSEDSVGGVPGKKIRSHVQQSSLRVQSLYWVKGAPSSIVAKAVSRAILTHASFLINETHEVSDIEWISAACAAGSLLDAKKIEVIDMANPNMSLNEKIQFLKQISSLSYHNILLITSVLTTLEEPAILHHSYQSEDNTLHVIHFGKRTAIGLAGTKGAPSQTLRRTHRGILKDYALKQRNARSAAGEFARSNISTAMEPEIGFLMANIALAKKLDATTSTTLTTKKTNPVRVLDPCCGSGSLLLYAGALERESHLVGVDADSSVWIEAEVEFQRHNLAEPVFVNGDIFDPLLMTSNSFDAIICDPPYNIGAPVITGKQDLRPNNHHLTNRKQTAHESIAPNDDKISAKNTTASIIHLAGRVLVDGGRIAFFLPMKGTQIPSAIEQYTPNIESARLQSVFERRQMFSPTFSRWLVCLEKIVT